LHYLQNLIEQLDFSSMGAAFLRVAAVFLCLTIHETCHGLMACALGDPTAKRMHRLSLNPLRHIDWFGLLMMFVCGFGWAKPVPVDMRYFKNPKRGMALTALAGPASNFLLAILLLFICKGIYLYCRATTVWTTLFSFSLMTAVLSVGLGLFNLVPIPPLDGSKILAAALPDRAYVQLMRYERYGMILLILLSVTDIGGGAISGAIGAVFHGLCGLCGVPEFYSLLYS
jgi:Zn-dependent proteases